MTSLFVTEVISWQVSPLLKYINSFATMKDKQCKLLESFDLRRSKKFAKENILKIEQNI